ncbi:MAG: MBL fold metallo-hydrolase, partial [Dehalococcoidia bacterium]
MIPYICRICGTQHAESKATPERCIICDDERQYIGRGGQQWTTLEELRSSGHKNVFLTVDPGVEGIHTYPQFAIGQRMLLIGTARGNFLWDMISFIDDETVSAIKQMGGVQGMAISHPHF